MTKQNRNIIFTTIAIEAETDKLIEKLCKRYSLKKGEITKLAFLYLDKAHINPADAPESVKTELAKINKRQDDIIRFIRSYEEDKLTYNNAGSSRRLADYCEHEDMERMEHGIYTEGFFNLTDDNIYKSQVIKDIDSNIGHLLKTDAKFYAIHVSPSEKELRAMGSTEREQAEAMKRYIREVLIPEYAKNFNKGLSAEDIKFYGKIHFSRDRSNNELNMHCHLIVSRKDQSNKKKLSPLTNHKSTTKGTVKGGFDRKNLFRQAEQGFDRLFSYNRPLTESFEYYNTMKNGSISDQLKMQERQVASTEIQPANQLNVGTAIQPDIPTLQQLDNKQPNINISDSGLSSIFSLLTLDVSQEEEQTPVKRKKKKPKRGFRQG